MSKRLIYAEDAIDAIEQLVIPEDMCVFEILSHIELAIGTLPSAQPEKMQLSKEDATKGTTFDCISRQAAIDSVCEVCENCEYFKNEKLIQTIKDLPSAQPEHTETHSCDYECTETHDLISRQSAIKTFHDEIVRKRIDEDTNDDGTLDEFDTEAILRRLPSAQRWIPVTEALPKEEDCPMDCLVTRKSKFIGNYTDMAVCEKNGTWTHEDWDAIVLGDVKDGKSTGLISTRDDNIIAWMPLPEPYKEGQE